ncbi:uncharacterized HTH-type transcriptional regulator Mb1846 [Arthrobacter sp. Hiyo4]|nr:uncharacterized HTH-type transcriptional regulator Mb1846 [Arthrobacter sp. Hiyo4]
MLCDRPAHGPRARYYVYIVHDFTFGIFVIDSTALSVACTSGRQLSRAVLVDAYSELGDAVDAAVNALPERDFIGRFKALGRAVRTWGLREPARYGLLFGSPVPGYQAPAGQTTTQGTRVIYRLIDILDGAHRAGELTEAALTAVVPSALSADLEAISSELGLTMPDELQANGALVWTSIFGAVSFEVFGQYGPDTFRAREELFEHHLTVLAGVAGLDA